jgi:GntR family transcriptional regulator, rspAB operon transcriptional repressor
MGKAPKQKPAALADWTYQYLKKGILNLDFKPGEQLHIEEFAEELEVSRTPIREAFLRLASEGLVDVRSRVGYFVSEMTEQDMKDLFEVREIVETRAARLAAKELSDGEIAKLRKLMEESAEAVVNEDLSTYIENDVRFHGYLQKHVTNKRLLAVMDSMNDLTHRERILSIRSPENVRHTLVEHNRIVDALEKRDEDAAGKLMAEHLQNVCQRLVEFIDKYPNLIFKE